MGGRHGGSGCARALAGARSTRWCLPAHPPPPKHTPTHLLSQVLLVDAEKGAIVVKGAVPGKRGNIVEVAPTKVVGVNV